VRMLRFPQVNALLNSAMLILCRISIPSEKTDPHGHTLLSASDDGSVKLWDVRVPGNAQLEASAPASRTPQI
jgi:WD40 repeat protein